MEPFENTVDTGAASPISDAYATKSKEELLDEFRTLLQDGQQLLAETANLSGEALAAARARFQTQWDVAKEKLDEAQTYAVSRTQQATRVTDEYVHEHPWSAVAVATGVGVVLGLLAGKRNSTSHVTRR
ncbi:MAG TPA: DUF883 family protein [Methylophilaceae bacterium]|nr:DUF883 family protein [Methylophilaceae bacterium]